MSESLFLVQRHRSNLLIKCWLKESKVDHSCTFLEGWSQV
jgi:hypothetical protein